MINLVFGVYLYIGCFFLVSIRRRWVLYAIWSVEDLHLDPVVHRGHLDILDE